MEPLGIFYSRPSRKHRLASWIPLVPSDFGSTTIRYVGKGEEGHHAHGSVHVGERRGGHGEVSVDHLRGKVG